MKNIILFSLLWFCYLLNGCKKKSADPVEVLPAGPTILTETVVSPTQINLNWKDNSTNEAGFKIERKTGAGAYAVITITAGNSNSYSDIGLSPNTTYTYRVYSFNSVGNSINSNEVIAKTINDPSYLEPVTIGSQIWALKNLDVAVFRNGDIIPQVSDQNIWSSINTPAWCYYEIDPANGTDYGKLYNWAAVNDSRGLAPSGWHIPSDGEWTALTIFLGGESTAGGKMKAIVLWSSPNSAATNSSGYTGLPGGFRYSNGVFGDKGYAARWWSSTESNSQNAWFRSVFYGNGLLYKGTPDKRQGFSVRCIKD